MEPDRIMSAAAWMPKVAEEQATFMSKAKPPVPQQLLDLDCDGRIGAFVVGGGTDHRIHIACLHACHGERG
jgi:hypothetical protein